MAALRSPRQRPLQSAAPLTGGKMLPSGELRIGLQAGTLLCEAARANQPDIATGPNAWATGV